MKTEPEFDSLVPPQTFDRRSFLVDQSGRRIRLGHAAGDGTNRDQDR